MFEIHIKNQDVNFVLDMDFNMIEKPRVLVQNKNVAPLQEIFEKVEMLRTTNGD